jgi:hypothetical protein
VPESCAPDGDEQAAREQLETGTMIPGPGPTGERIVADLVAVDRDDLECVLDMLIWVPGMTRETWEAAALRLRAALAVPGA